MARTRACLWLLHADTRISRPRLCLPRIPHGDVSPWPQIRERRPRLPRTRRQLAYVLRPEGRYGRTGYRSPGIRFLSFWGDAVVTSDGWDLARTSASRPRGAIGPCLSGDLAQRRRRAGHRNGHAEHRARYQRL